MKKKLSGQITIETSIVFPIVMMIVASLIFISFYIHDVTTIKSFMYSAGIQNIEKDFDEFERQIKAKTQKIPIFIIKPQITCKEKNSHYEIIVNGNYNNQIKWLKNIMASNKIIQTIKVEKNMSGEIMYGLRAVSDELMERRSK